MKTPVFYTEAPPYIAPPSIKETIKDLGGFILRPAPLKREHNVVETKLPLIFQLAFLELILQVVLFVALAFMYKAISSEYLSTSLSDAFSADAAFIPLLVTVMLLAPVTEEIIFRLPLTFSKTFILVAIITFIITYGPTLTSVLNLPLLFFYAASVPAVGAVVWFLKSRRGVARLYLFWKRQFGWVFYASTIAFAFMYMLNYRGSVWPLPVLVLLTLPKFLGGIFLGYTRLRLGVGWAVALHMFNNMVVLFMMFGYLARS